MNTSSITIRGEAQWREFIELNGDLLDMNEAEALDLAHAGLLIIGGGVDPLFQVTFVEGLQR